QPLHVDARVVAALNRGQDDPRAAGVEERERGGLLPTRSLVGVVADDRGVQDRPVDAAVYPGERGGDLVDRLVQVVDARLEGDGEIDEVVLALAEQHELARAEAPYLNREIDAEAERSPGRAGRA